MSGNSSHGAHESTDVPFNKALWIIPLSMVLLVVFAAICWFGATQTLKREIASKQVAGADSTTPPSTGTP